MTTPEHLVRAVRAALDEMERTAQRAAETARGETWQLDDLGCCLATDEAGVILSAEMGWTDPKPVAQHIAHNDPAAVLRRVAADRRVLDRHEPRRLPATHYRPEVVECEHCVRMCHSRSGLACDDPTDAPWPCDEIRDLCDRLGINPETEEQ